MMREGAAAEDGRHEHPWPSAMAGAMGKDAGASSSGAAVRSTTTMDATMEVVTQRGIKMKLHGPIENPWSHGQPYGSGFKCDYCITKIKGGGVTRLREHFASLQGNVVACANVPLNVKKIMQNEALFRKTRKRVTHEQRLFIEKEIALAKRGLGTVVRATNIPLDEVGQIEMAIRESLMDVGLQGGTSSPFGRPGSSGAASCSTNKQQTTLDKFYRSPSASSVPFDIDLSRSRAQVQPRVDVMLKGDARERLGIALAKWFHANDIPGRKADCPYFRSAIMLAQQLGEGVQIPHGREIDGQYLEMNYDDMGEHLNEFKDDWREYGVTVMCDS